MNTIPTLSIPERIVEDFYQHSLGLPYGARLDLETAADQREAGLMLKNSAEAYLDLGGFIWALAAYRILSGSAIIFEGCWQIDLITKPRGFLL